MLRERPNYVKEKNSIKQTGIMRPNACALPLVCEFLFRDGTGGKSKSLEMGWGRGGGGQGFSAAPGGSQGAPALKLKAFSKSKV